MLEDGDLIKSKLRDIVKKAEIITHEEPVNAPLSSCFLIILLKNKLNKILIYLFFSLHKSIAIKINTKKNKLIKKKLFSWKT